MSEQKRLYRSSANRVIGGVCGGLGQYLGIDPMLVRLAFVVLALVNGLGVLLYFIIWLLVPGKTDSELSGEDVMRANLEDMSAQARRVGGSLHTSQGAAIIGLVLVVAGAMFLLKQFIPGLSPHLLWPVLLIGLGVLLLARR
jgi:phage shock protein C